MRRYLAVTAPSSPSAAATLALAPRDGADAASGARPVV